MKKKITKKKDLPPMFLEMENMGLIDMKYNNKKRDWIMKMTPKGFKAAKKDMKKNKDAQLFLASLIRNDIAEYARNHKPEDVMEKSLKAVRLIKKDFGFDLMKVWKKIEKIEKEEDEKTRYIG